MENQLTEQFWLGVVFNLLKLVLKHPKFYVIWLNLSNDIKIMFVCRSFLSALTYYLNWSKLVSKPIKEKLNLYFILFEKLRNRSFLVSVWSTVFQLNHFFFKKNLHEKGYFCVKLYHFKKEIVHCKVSQKTQFWRSFRKQISDPDNFKFCFNQNF